MGLSEGTTRPGTKSLKPWPYKTVDLHFYSNVIVAILHFVSGISDSSQVNFIPS